MNFEDELNARKAPTGGDLAGAICAAQACSNRAYSLRDEALKNSAYHAEQRQKHSAAADFLGKHPEFDEFVRLIRSGAIHIWRSNKADRPVP